MEQQNKYRVIVSARAAQMLVSHAAFLAQVNPAAAERLTVEFEKGCKNLWSRCRSAAHGSKANTFLKMLTDLSCLKNAICLSSRS